MAKRNAQLIAFEVSKIFGDGKDTEGGGVSSGGRDFGEAMAEVW